MRVLIVSDDANLRRRLAGELESTRRTASACEVQRAPAAIRSQVPDVLVVHIATRDDLAIISSLAAEASSMYVLALLGEELPARASAAAIAAGSQDVLPMPYTREQLHLRVDARERLCRWIGAPHDQAQVQAGMPKLRSWQYLDTIVADDLEGMLGKRVTLTEKRMPAIAAMQLATIPMTLPDAQLDLCISIVADAPARTWLGVALLGDDTAGDEVVQDIMRELANLAGGAFKRSAFVERSTVGTGIPIDNDRTPFGPHARYWEVATEDGCVFGLIADVRVRPNRRVPARRLAEGMVVVKDVVNGAGVLLLPSGTRLTSTTAERLSRLLDQTLIDVCA
jgi:DNA-binding response OmpR family regulator